MGATGGGGSGEPLPATWAVITILKAMIGAGILNLPKAFGSVRLAVGVPGYMAITAICGFSVYRLLQCKQLVMQKAGLTKLSDASGDSSSDEEDRLAYSEHLGLGPMEVVATAAFGQYAIPFVVFGIIASQLGFCVAYIDVVVETMLQKEYLGGYMSDFQLRCAVCGALCLLSLIRKLGLIAKLSGVALLIYCYLFFALVRNGSQELSGPDPIWAEKDWLPVGVDNLGGYFGTVLFAQEAIVITQYVYDDMQLESPRQFLPVLSLSFAACGLLCTFVGGFGYMAYGENIKQVFYMNFPTGSPDITVAELVLCAVLVVTFILQMFPVVSFLEAVVLGVDHPGSLPEEESGDSEVSDNSDAPPAKAQRFGLRSALMRFAMVILCSVIAGVVPDLSCVTGYSGSFAVSVIGFFLPPLCHLVLTKFQAKWYDVVLDSVLILSGVSALYFGITSTNCGG